MSKALVWVVCPFCGEGDFDLWYAAGRGYDEFTAANITYETRGALDAGTLRIPERFRGPYRGWSAT